MLRSSLHRISWQRLVNDVQAQEVKQLRSARGVEEADKGKQHTTTPKRSDQTQELAAPLAKGLNGEEKGGGKAVGRSGGGFYAAEIANMGTLLSHDLAAISQRHAPSAHPSLAAA